MRTSIFLLLFFALLQYSDMLFAGKGFSKLGRSQDRVMPFNPPPQSPVSNRARERKSDTSEIQTLDRQPSDSMNVQGARSLLNNRFDAQNRDTIFAALVEINSGRFSKSPDKRRILRRYPRKRLL